jgi:hypothetical protein
MSMIEVLTKKIEMRQELCPLLGKKTGRYNLVVQNLKPGTNPIQNNSTTRD